MEQGLAAVPEVRVWVGLALKEKLYFSMILSVYTENAISFQDVNPYHITDHIVLILYTLSSMGNTF